MNVANPRSDPPSSARQSLPTPADEDDGFPFDADEAFLQLRDGEDWPAHFGAARPGSP